MDAGGTAYPQAMDWHQPGLAAGDGLGASCTPIPGATYEDHPLLPSGRDARVTLAALPNEVLLHVLSFLDVSDLLATSRVSARLFVAGRGGACVSWGMPMSPHSCPPCACYC